MSLEWKKWQDPIVPECSKLILSFRSPGKTLTISGLSLANILLSFIVLLNVEADLLRIQLVSPVGPKYG